jgi:hypothetical protein
MMIIRPAAISIYRRAPLKITRPEKTALITIKTALNPKTKKKVRRISRPGEGSSGVSPAPIKKRYEGIRGKTQGEKNESSPAAKAKTSDTSPDILKLIIYRPAPFRARKRRTFFPASPSGFAVYGPGLPINSILILMKRVFFFSGFLLAAALLIAQAPDFIVKDRVLVKYRGAAQLVAIPSNLGVDRIGERAFAGTPLVSVKIPPGIAFIDERAFAGCSFLTEVSLPNTLTVIGRRAFFNCVMLEKINLPRSLISIGDGAFFNCRSLRELDIPDTLRTIGGRAFSGCLGLEKFSLSRRTKLGEHALMGLRCPVDYKD